jgi:GTP-binding protein HflX
LLKDKLGKIEAHRLTQSAGRKGFVKIAIAGYTNAGKSTLFNLLTRSNVFAEDKLFATLDSTTRALDLDDNYKLLISDTVGFIRKLPAHLVASFKSTLNEVRDADIILHVIDMSHPYYEDHIKVVEETLKEFGSLEKRVIKVFNKVDLISDKSLIEFVKNSYKESVLVSASKGINISSLKSMLKNILNENVIEEKIELSLVETKKASLIHSFAEVLKTEYDDDKVLIIYRATKQNSEKIKKIIHAGI